MSIRALTIRTGKALGVLALLSAPAVLNRWLIIDDIFANEAVAHASAETKSTLNLRPRGQSFSMLGKLEAMLPRQKGGQVSLEDIPDRFAELLLEQPEAEPEAHVRRWFPRTFLWAPRLVTDDAGTGVLTITMPDTLTDWSVVGMSLSAEGSIGGGSLSLQTRQPVHAEIRAPDVLRVGDAVAVPVTAVNHDEAPRAIALSLDDDAIPLSLGAWGTQTVPWRITASQAGPRTLTATLGGADTVEHALQVVPVGLPEHTIASGAVVSDLTIALPPEAARLQLTLLPAQAALARAAQGMGSPATPLEAAFQVALGCHLGDELLRQRGSIALSQGQWHEREPSIDLLRLAALGCPEHLPEQDDNWLLRSQKPDGSWTVPSGAPLSHLLTLAALNVRTADHPRATLRTSALLERHSGRITDALSAAMVLGAGLVDSGTAEHLRGILEEAIGQDEDGQVTVTGPLGVRPDGEPATELDVLAAAALVMPDLAAPIRATLAGALAPDGGWGDGLTGLLILRALSEAPPTHAATTVHLLRDDGTELVSLSVPDGAASVSLDLGQAPESVRLVVDGPVSPELSWRLVSTRWQATPPPPPPGLSGDLTRTGRLAVGEPVEIAVSVTADPDLSAVTLHHDLPAGVVWVPGSATFSGAPVEGSLSGGRLTLRLPEEDGVVRYRVVPTLAGEVSDGGVSLQADEQLLWLGAGPRWRVAESR